MSYYPNQTIKENKPGSSKTQSRMTFEMRSMMYANLLSLVILLIMAIMATTV